MRTMEHAAKWEVDGLARRLDALEERQRRRDQERLQNATLLLWLVWVAAIAAMVAIAAAS